MIGVGLSEKVAVLGLGIIGLGGVTRKPSAIQSIAVRLSGSSKPPSTIPHFNPRVVTPQVRPHRRARHPRRDPDGATRVY